MKFIGTAKTYRKGDIGGDALEDLVVTFEVTQTTPDGEIELAYDIRNQRRYLWFSMADLIDNALMRCSLTRGEEK